jgi:hypothetical protein
VWEDLITQSRYPIWRCQLNGILPFYEQDALCATWPKMLNTIVAPSTLGTMKFLHFLWSFHQWRGLGPLFEQTWIPFMQEWFVQSLIDIGHLLKEIDYLRFYVPLKNWRRHQCRWRAEKFRPTLGTQGLWAGRDLYRATPAVTQDLVFFSLIRRTAPFSHLLWHTRGCGGSILTQILTGSLRRRFLKTFFQYKHM